jgi:WD40 repeat protein
MGCNKSGGQLMNNRILIPKTGSMEILDVNNLVYEKRIYRPSENDGLGIYVSQDGTIMVTASKNAAYRWTLSTPFDIATRTLEHSASMPYTSIYSIGFSPDGLHFFIGARDSMNYYMVIEVILIAFMEGNISCFHPMVQRFILTEIQVHTI